MIKDLTQWDRRKVGLFIIIAVIASGFGTITFGSKTTVHQGLPFSFYRYQESTSEQVSQRPLVFVAPAFILDLLVWYMIAHFAVRFYDNSKLREKSVGFIARAKIKGA
jgi:hypothetical protein